MSTKTGEIHNRLHDGDSDPLSPPNETQQHRSYLESDFNEPDDHKTALMSQEGATENTPECSEDVANADSASLKSHEGHDPIVKGFDTRYAKKDVVIAIFIGLAGAFVGILGHHFFLSYLDGRIVEGRSQFWLRNASNAFAQVVVMFMGIVATSLLTQAVWREVSQNYTRIAIIDHSFSLPSPISIISLVYKQPDSILSIPLALSLLVQSLVIVSILAPNSLSIDVSEWRNITTAIPILDFANLSIPTTPSNAMPPPNDWTEMLAIPSLESYWNPPLGCEANCSFALEYPAPTLSCRNLTKSEIKLQPPDGHKWTYFSIVTSYSPEQTLGWGDPYPTFWIYYIPNTSDTIENDSLLVVNQTGLMGGLQCDFVDGTYRAAFEFANGMKSVTKTLISSSNGSIQGCSWTSLQKNSYCADYRYNAELLSTGFIPKPASQDWELFVTENSTIPMWAASGWNTESEPVLSTIMKANSTGASTFLSITTPNMGLVLEDLFSNITLKGILSDQQTKPGSILSSNGQSVWRYAPRTLWVIYGPALALLLLASSIYGQYSIFRNGILMKKDFSTVLVSTRNRDINKVCTLNSDALVEKSLRFNPAHRHFDINSELFMGEKSHGDIPGGLPNSWAMGIMITAFLAAILLSGSHHLYLSYLNGRKVSLFSQFWIKNISNGFAHATTLCLQLVATYSLTQTVWQILGAQGIAIPAINHLFSLPSPDASVLLFTASWFASLVPAAFLVWTTYALPLVNTLAPNALTIGSSAKTAFDLTIPIFNYSQYWGMIDGIADLASNGIPPEQLWDIPAECGLYCEFKFEYEALGLSCIDSLVNNSLGFTDDKWVAWIFVNTPSSMWYHPRNFTFGIEYFPTIVHIPNDFNPTVLSYGTPAGSLCQVQDATYEASFLYSNGINNASTTLLHYNNSFTDGCSWNQEFLLSQECQNYENITSDLWGTFYDSAFPAFAPYIGDNAAYTTWVPAFLGSPLEGIFTFVNNTEEKIISSSLKVPNMSEAIVDLFSNFTLSVMSASPNTTTVNAFRWGDTVWKFDVADLWYVYGPAHALTLLALLYGLYCIHNNGKALDNNFLTLMLATRGEELDDAVQNAPNYDALMRLRLRKEKERYFVVDNDQLDGSVEQSDPEST